MLLLAVFAGLGGTTVGAIVVALKIIEIVLPPKSPSFRSNSTSVRRTCVPPRNNSRSGSTTPGSARST
jgi:hypothetical protein